MVRDYPYEGFNVHVEVKACASMTPRKFGMPNVEFSADVTITKRGTATPAVPQIHLSASDGRGFSSAGETLLSAGNAGRCVIDRLLRS